MLQHSTLKKSERTITPLKRAKERLKLAEIDNGNLFYNAML